MGTSLGYPTVKILGLHLSRDNFQGSVTQGGGGGEGVMCRINSLRSLIFLSLVLESLTSLKKKSSTTLMTPIRALR